MEELLNSSLGFGYISHLDAYFADNSDSLIQKIYQKRIICQDFDQCAKWVGNNRNFSLIYTQVLEAYLRSKSTLQQDTDRSLLCKLDDGDFLPITYAMGMSKDNPLLPFVDTIILRIVESGIFLKRKQESFELEKIKAKNFMLPSLISDYCDLNMKHMQPAFYLLFLGSGLASTIFILEFLSSLFCSDLIVSRFKAQCF